LEVLNSGRCPFSRVQVNLHYPWLPHTSLGISLFELLTTNPCHLLFVCR
jgi:hypothetical protein